MLFGNIKRRFLAYSSLSYADFRHLNIRVAKNNLAYPLLKDIFSILGTSGCKVSSDAFTP